MSDPASSSLSHSRSTAFLLASATAAIAAFIIYTRAERPYKTELRRSRTVRRMQRHDHSTTPSPSGSDVAPADERSSDQDESMLPLTEAMYHIAANRFWDSVEHRSVRCSECSQTPIRGIRWHCAHCYDYDLCSKCEASDLHPRTHLLYKIRIPAPHLSLPVQGPVYPGHSTYEESRDVFNRAPNGLKTHLASKLELDQGTTLRLLWDQFAALAPTKWEDDPNLFKWAIDRAAFNRTFIPKLSAYTPRNLIHDRYFAHYDTDANGLIGFEEFIAGLTKLHETDAIKKLPTIFRGYDFDGDGYISRQDCLRILRAQYALEKENMRDSILHDTRSPHSGSPTVPSVGPLASAFGYSEGVAQPPAPVGSPADDFLPVDNPRVTEPETVRHLPSERRQFVDEDSWFPDRPNERNAMSRFPKAEADIGNEYLYQICEAGFNSMLNPIFLDREQAAKETSTTQARRAQVQRPPGSPADFDPLAKFYSRANFVAYSNGIFRYLKAVVRDLMLVPFRPFPDGAMVEYWKGKISDIETSVCQERFTQTSTGVVPVYELARMHFIREKFLADWLAAMITIRLKNVHGTVEISEAGGAGLLGVDPTMPQFRPSSSDEESYRSFAKGGLLVRTCDYTSPDLHHIAPELDMGVDNWSPVVFLVCENRLRQNTWPVINWTRHNLTGQPSDESHAPSFAEQCIEEYHLASLARSWFQTPRPDLDRLKLGDVRELLSAFYDYANAESDARGGPGRINLSELEGYYKSGMDIRFLECWTNWMPF